jgi:hypothetical protein
MNAPFAKQKTADLDAARTFIAALTGSPDTVMRFRFIDDDKSKTRADRLPSQERQGPIALLWPEVLSFQKQGYGTFYFVSEMRAGIEGFATDADAIRARALAADFDDRVPDEWEWHSLPSLIVHTSAGKGQALWLAPDGFRLGDFKPVSRRLIAYYGSDPAVQNLSRILRLPGTLHLKSEPQLVTFDALENRGAVLENLPELPASKGASPAIGAPVQLPHLRTLLASIDPDVPYPKWRDIVAGLHATNAGTEDDRLGLAVEWSRGALTDTTPVRYDGEDAVVRVWETMPAREGGVGYGTLWYAAKAAGYQGRSAAALPPVSMAHAFPAVSTTWIRGADTLARVVPPVPKELIAGLVEKGITTFLSAPGKTFKSRVSIQWGMCLDAEHPVFGRPVEKATFIYLSYEDHADEVARRMQAIRGRLGLPEKPTFEWADLRRKNKALAIVGDEVEPQPFHAELMDRVGSIEGHKFVVLDSTYNALRFRGSAKIDEGSVLQAVNFLDDICDKTDSSFMPLWHPSEAGMERGDASGWSVAWKNAPRARLSMTRDKDNRDVISLKVEARNNAPEPKDPILLIYDAGILVPAVEGADVEKIQRDACVAVASAAAAQGNPIVPKAPNGFLTWQLDDIERRCGKRLNKRDITAHLERETNPESGRLRYQRRDGRQQAGYFPRDASPRPAEQT